MRPAHHLVEKARDQPALHAAARGYEAGRCSEAERDFLTLRIETVELDAHQLGMCGFRLCVVAIHGDLSKEPHGNADDRKNDDEQIKAA